MKLSLLFPETRSIDNVRALIGDTERGGFHGMWLGAAFGFDPITAFAVAGQASSSLSLGVAVVPAWPRHPIALAQQAATASAALGGRFRLGIGPSHDLVMRMYGLPFDRPIGRLREYLTILRALLHDGSSSHRGEHYRVTGFLDVEGAVPPPVLLGVLRPQMARLAGELGDGALCWLTPAAYLRDVIVANVAAGAGAAERSAPPVVAELPCALTTDRDALREMAARDLGIYPQVSSYRAMLEAAGVEVGEGWSDDMLDAAVVHGDEDGLAKRIHEFFEAGADEVVLSPFGVGDDPDASRRDCIRVLSDICKEI